MVDHGPRLVGLVAEGSLDAAFVAIAGQMELPKGVVSQVVGVDRIGVLVPATCDLHSTDRRQFAGRTVVTYTTDYSGEELDGRVVALGATPYRAATAETAVRLGRLLGHPVVLPRSLLRAYLIESDRELATTRFGGPRLSLVTRVPTAPYWKSALPIVGRELGLSGVSCSYLTSMGHRAGATDSSSSFKLKRNVLGLRRHQIVPAGTPNRKALHEHSRSSGRSTSRSTATAR